jgi:hypothetical protein
MRRAIKIGLAVVAVMAVLPIVLIIMLIVGRPHFTPPQFVRREMQLANHGSLIIDGNARGRSAPDRSFLVNNIAMTIRIC